MKIDIALAGCQMIKRTAEDYRVWFGCLFSEGGENRLWCFCVSSTWHQGPNSELRPRVTVKTLPHYVDLEELHFVYLDLVGLTKVFVVTLINTQSHCANVEEAPQAL